MRRAWLAMWLVACASGSSTEGSSGVASLGQGSASTSTSSGDGAGSSSTAAASTEAASTVDGSSSGAPVIGCGNAVVEAGEECDDGDDDPCNGCDGCLRRTYLVLDGGRGHAVELADAAEAPLRLLGTAFTVEAWVRTDAAGDDLEIARRGAGNAGWRLSVQPDGVVATVFSGFDHFVAGAAPPGSGWHHLAWTYDLTVSRLWLDGEPIGDFMGGAAVLETDAPLRLGALVDGSGVVFGWGAGQVDEIRVSSTIRYAEPFVPVRRHEPDEATVLLLHLDEGEGAGVIDASPHAHAGTAVGVSWALDDGYGECG